MTTASPANALSAASYIPPQEYELWGVPTATPQQVFRASRLVDAFCRRQRWGFLYALDATGAPAYMPTATPDFEWKSPGALSPGQNVPVQVQPYALPAEPYVGHTVTLDVANPATTEVCVVASVNSPSAGYITLANVQFAHSSGCTIQGGLQIFEERFLPVDRSLARLSQWPITRIVSGLGRYSYGRRSQQVQGNYSEFNLLAILQNFGGPPTWEPLDVTNLGLNQVTGEVWVPAGVLLAYYSDARFWYVGGWTQGDLPAPIKQACANIVANNQQALGTPMASTLFKSAAAGNVKIERFADKAIDEETRSLLTPFRARSLF